MLSPKLTEDQIKIVLSRAGLNSAEHISKIDIGFSNDVYAIGNKYIFKSSRSEKDNISFKKEVYLCSLLKDKIPVPTILFSDTNQSVIDRACIIYGKIEGDNLYMRWHEYSIGEKKAVIKQICEYLKVINMTPFKDFADAFGIDITSSWREKVTSKIQTAKRSAIEKKALPPDLESQVDRFVNKYKSVLDESSIALTYFDVHFDNFLVRDGKVVGMVDFERTDILSIDYVLDLVQRMVDQPTKYASENAEPLIAAKDYVHLMDWYKEFYPELFQFSHMDVRLKLYAIEHDLGDLYGWPGADSLRQELAKNSSEMTK